MSKIEKSSQVPDALGPITEPSHPSVELAHHHKIWLAETIRRIEVTSWLDDAEVLRKLTLSDETTQACILNRAVLLGQSRGIVEEILDWNTHGRLALTLFAVLAFLGGFLVAASALGDGSRTVNIVFALVTLLGIHLFTLLVWILSVVYGQRARPGVLGTLWMRLTARLTTSTNRPLLLQSLLAMLGRARLLPWLFGGVSHALWSLAFLGILGGLLFMLAFREYHFSWDTTILPTEFFIALTQTLGSIPQMFGFLSPDATLVRNPASRANAQAVWASWLIGCVVIYGLLPRVVLGIFCLMRSCRGLSRLDIDHALPYFIELKNRIQAAGGKGIIVDPNTGTGTGHRFSIVTPRTSRAGTGHGTLLLGIEIAEDIPWPPLPADTAVKTQRIASSHERQQVLRALSESPVKHLLIACDVHSTPDRGTLRLIAEVRSFSAHCKTWLMLHKGHTADPRRLAYWREELGRIGLVGDDVIEDERLALQWLEHDNG